MTTCPACQGPSDVAVEVDASGAGQCGRGHRWEVRTVRALVGCSFCGKQPPAAAALTRGPAGVAICEHCVALATELNRRAGVVADRWVMPDPDGPA
jgi:hypothetical protein